MRHRRGRTRSGEQRADALRGEEAAAAKFPRFRQEERISDALAALGKRLRKLVAQKIHRTLLIDASNRVAVEIAAFRSLENGPLEIGFKHGAQGSRCRTIERPAQAQDDNPPMIEDIRLFSAAQFLAVTTMKYTLSGVVSGKNRLTTPDEV